MQLFLLWNFLSDCLTNEKGHMKAYWTDFLSNTLKRVNTQLNIYRDFEHVGSY